METRQGNCNIENLHADDLLDALRTLKGKDGTGVHVPAPGDGVEKLLGWSMNDIHTAAMCGDKEEQERHATNAVVNARRALACLVDWYLARDGFAYCKNAPKSADDKAAILVRRNIIEPLTSRVLARAIAVRNVAEHEYQAVSCEDAEDVVELLRRTIQCLRAQSEPEWGPFVFGGMSWGSSGSEKGLFGHFYGWREPVGVVNTIAKEPWVGVIIPSSQSDATVRKVPLREIDRELLLESIAVLESTFGRVGFHSGASSCKLMAAAAGFE